MTEKRDGLDGLAERLNDIGRAAAQVVTAIKKAFTAPETQADYIPMEEP